MSYYSRQRLRRHVLACADRSSDSYTPLQETESNQLLFEFLSSSDFAAHFERYSISLIYAVTYGFRVPSESDPRITEIHRVQENLGLAGAFGKWIVDAIPVLNRLPMALAPWKRSAEEWYEIESKIHLKHMDFAKQTKAWNWTKEFANSNEGQGMDRLEMAYDLGILADAGLDTTAAVLQVFVLAALSQPSFLKEGKRTNRVFEIRATKDKMSIAQNELGTVIGRDRLPTLKTKQS